MIALPRVVNHENAMHVRADGLNKMHAQESIIDASALEEFDSSIFTVLLAWLRVSPGLQIVGSPEKLQTLARVYGLDQLFRLKKA